MLNKIQKKIKVVENDFFAMVNYLFYSKTSNK